MSPNEIIEILNSIDSRTEAIRSAEIDVATQIRKRDECYGVLAKMLGQHHNAVTNDWIRTHALAEVGRFHYENQKGRP